MTETSTLGERDRGALRLSARLFIASVAVGVIPIVVATGRAIQRGWLPLSDDAYFAIRARDVFSYHHMPLLGLVSSASLTAGATLNHPGPLLFDELALPVRLFGGDTGLALGIGLLNLGAVLGIAIFAYRRGGPLLGTAAMVAAAGLCWAMGSEALFEPWQPYSMMVLFLCFAVLAWSVACGDLLALPFAAIVASLVFQSHLSYALLVPTMAVWAVLGLILTLRRTRRENPDTWPEVRRRTVRFGSVTGIVALVCWIQPLIDELTGDGNLGHLLGSASPPKHTVGYDLGARLVASVVALPPWWFRPSIQHTFLTADGWRPPSLLSATIALVALGGGLAACVWLAQRRGDRIAARAVITSGIGLLAGLVTAARIPVTSLGLEAHVFRWLWALGVFAFFAVAATLVRAVARSPVWSTFAVGGFALTAAVFAMLNLPTTITTLTPNARQDAIPATRAIDRQLGSLTGKGPILIDHLYGGRFADPYGTAVIAELQRRGIPFVTRDRILIHQLGAARRFTGKNARSTLFLQVGNDRIAAPPGTPRVAHYEGLTSTQQRQLAAVEQQLAVYIRAGGLRLSRIGEAALASGRLPGLKSQLAAGQVDPDPLFVSGELVSMVRDGDLALAGPWFGRFEQYAILRALSDDHTVSLYLVSHT